MRNKIHYTFNGNTVETRFIATETLVMLALFTILAKASDMVFHNFNFYLTCVKFSGFFHLVVEKTIIKQILNVFSF